MTETLPALRKTVLVPLPPAPAFDLFALRLGEWWPLNSHSLSASEGRVPLDVTVEPRVGGRIVEIRHDGNPSEWGTITAWDSGRRLAVDWYVGRTPSQASRFEVVFEPEGTGSRVTLEHSGFERLGTAGAAAADSYDEGWDLVLGERFAGACSEEAGD